MKDSDRGFNWYLIGCPWLMWEIPGGIKALVILISNEMPDESTDQNTTQHPYRLTACFSVFFFFLFKDVEKKMELKSPKLHTPGEVGTCHPPLQKSGNLDT